MITLVLGGASSGKSAIGEKLVTRHAEPITYLATGVATDDEMAQRISAHQKRRPPSWGLVEATGHDLLPALEGITGSVLLESLGSWVASLLPEFSVTIADDLCDVLLRRNGDTVVVTEEVGLGVHPASELGRHFREDLGRLNAAVAEVADRALLVVAGRALALEQLM